MPHERPEIGDVAENRPASCLLPADGGPGTSVRQTPDLSSSPKPSSIIRRYCLNVAAASGRFSPASFASLSAMPESLAAWAALKKHECSRFCMSSPSVCNTRGSCAGLREHLTQHRHVEPERRTQAQPFREAGGVDVHDHVDQRLDLGRFSGLADISHRGTEAFPESVWRARTPPACRRP